jgi:hypothetical protein
VALLDICYDRIPVLYTSLVDRSNLVRLGEESLPPEYTLDRHIVGTSDKPSIEESTREDSRLRLRWMCDIDKEKRHNKYRLQKYSFSLFLPHLNKSSVWRDSHEVPRILDHHTIYTDRPTSESIAHIS